MHKFTKYYAAAAVAVPFWKRSLPNATFFVVGIQEVILEFGAR